MNGPMTNEEICAWITACNHEPAKEVLRDYMLIRQDQPSAEIDKRTGRPFGDHGTAMQAIDFAIECNEIAGEEVAFLYGWREGKLDEFPEFYEWLKTRESK